MIVLNAYCQLQPSLAEAALKFCAKNKATAVTEPGCLRFDYFTAAEDPLKVAFVEEWESRAALQAHFEADNFKEFTRDFFLCLDGDPDIRIFEASLVG